jgi:hypothetical protein
MTPSTLAISRRIMSLVLIAVISMLLAALVVARADRASAASFDALLEIRGPGTTYAGPGGTAGLVVGAGDTATYLVKVVNTGPGASQFKLQTLAFNNPAVTKMTLGTTDVTSIASNPEGLFTPPIGPGDSVTYKLRVTLPDDAARGSALIETRIYTTLGTQFGSVKANTFLEAPAQGTTSWDLLARAGSDQFVGGSIGEQAFAAPIKTGRTAAFRLRLQNDGSLPSTIGLKIDYSPECMSAFPMTVKDGAKNVTAATTAGTYATPSLVAGRHRDLRVTFTRGPLHPLCPIGLADATALQGQNGVPQVDQILTVQGAAS